MKANSILLDQFNIEELLNKSDAEIFQMQSAQRYKTIRNNFIFVQILNIICLCGNTFGMSYYRWYKLQSKNGEYLWLNLLYIYDESNKNYMSFYEYKQSSTNVCYQNAQNINVEKCLNDFTILQYISGFCFFCICVSMIFLLYDIVRLKLVLEALQQQKKLNSVMKGFLVYAIIIGTQSFALIVYIIAILTLQSLGLYFSYFGASYIVCWLCCGAMVAFAVYYKWSKARYQRFLIMERLVGSDLSQDNQSIELRRNQNDDIEII